jgi:hypothetical protein
VHGILRVALRIVSCHRPALRQQHASVCRMLSARTKRGLSNICGFRCGAYCGGNGVPDLGLSARGRSIRCLAVAWRLEAPIRASLNSSFASMPMSLPVSSTFSTLSTCILSGRGLCCTSVAPLLHLCCCGWRGYALFARASSGEKLEKVHPLTYAEHPLTYAEHTPAP